jgi:hypothetical protein
MAAVKKKAHELTRSSDLYDDNEPIVLYNSSTKGGTKEEQREQVGMKP